VIKHVWKLKVKSPIVERLVMEITLYNQWWIRLWIRLKEGFFASKPERNQQRLGFCGPSHGLSIYFSVLGWGSSLVGVVCRNRKRCNRVRFWGRSCLLGLVGGWWFWRKRRRKGEWGRGRERRGSIRVYMGGFNFMFCMYFNLLAIFILQISHPLSRNSLHLPFLHFARVKYNPLHLDRNLRTSRTKDIKTER